MKIFNSKNNRGFTLLETLVAIALLAVVIVAPIEFSRSGLLTSFLARDQMIAHGLAQDAIETIRNIKDSNSKSAGKTWFEGLSPCVNNICSINTSIGGTVAVGSCGSSSCRPLTTLEDDGVVLYGYGGKESKFTRDVTIRTIDIPSGTEFDDEGNETIVEAANEAVVTVRVKWRPRPNTEEKTLVIHEHLFNWND